MPCEAVVTGAAVRGLDGADAVISSSHPNDHHDADGIVAMADEADEHADAELARIKAPLLQHGHTSDILCLAW